MKALEFILKFLTLEQIMGSLHPCQRKPSELIAESARRSEQAKREEQALQQVKEREENRIRIAMQEAAYYKLHPHSEEVQPIYLPPPSKRRLGQRTPHFLNNHAYPVPSITNGAAATLPELPPERLDK